MSEHSPSFCIVGAGMSGLLMAIRLRKAGYRNIRILEKAASLGGTWRENTYPGVACDVPSHYYSYSFFHKADWSRKFAPGAEILGYFEDVSRKFGLSEHLEFNQQVINARFDGKQWTVETRNAERFKVDFLISACGILHQPVYPDITGLNSFSGELFHSARWDHQVTLAGKRVGVIGCGSTGIQMVPPLAREAATLSLFQRTPQWIMPVKDVVYSPLMKVLRRYLPGFAKLQYLKEKATFELFSELVLKDGWQRRLAVKFTRLNLDRVEDPALRQKLTPDYLPGCKRLVMSNAFYPAIARENVALVTEKIASVCPQGVTTADGTVHPMDVLILATGFNPQAYMQPMALVNEHGLSLTEAWRDEIKAYHTVALPEFANFFMLLGPNSPVGNFSVIAAAEVQADYILQCVAEKCRSRADAIVVKEEATQAFNLRLRQAMEGSVWLTGCASWYLDRQGNPVTWPWTPKRFFKELAKPDFDDFTTTRSEG